jgi:hypothetical protein
MEEKETKAIRETILDAMATGLRAQLRAVQRLRGGEAVGVEKKRPKGMSQVDIAYDILKRASKELHISEIIRRAEKVHGVKLDRESVVSAITKRVQRGDRFVRTGPNVFGLKEGGR